MTFMWYVARLLVFAIVLTLEAIARREGGGGGIGADFLQEFPHTTADTKMF